ncbi:NAD(P)-dependent oxidoreductase [Sandaracinus amylolyticus]|uniref:NAD(P)-dependent oxidoreductase n=1 Tax=Sandaracinus amylolyticus TaxID=927083 RepID=UPI001F2A29BC|nr:NAD(P)-dependent oxidoreductase [Sandaracinus amylolyticus]UJR86692.1 Hypothetical protein I5071_87930 [Sandaracinus amylolyticus]
MTARPTVAFLGLGHMGRGMVASLQRAGLGVRAWNRTPGRVAPSDGLELCATPREAVRDVALVITSLADDTAVRDATLGREGFLDAMTPDAVHVGTSTISWTLAQELSDAHARRGTHYVAAPVLGRPDAAERGALTVLVGGEPAVVARARPIFDAIGGSTLDTGTAAHAHLTKIIANFAIASTIELVGEATALGEKAGIPPERLVEVLGKTVVASPILRGYGERIARGELEPAGFRLELGLKDVSLALAASTQLRAPLPIASLLRDHILEGIAKGRGQQDWAALATVAREAAGVTTRG